MAKPNQQDDRLLSLEAFRRQQRDGANGITATITALTEQIETMKTGWVLYPGHSQYYAPGQLWALGNQTALFQKGLRIKIRQDGVVKYLVVTSSTYGSFTVIDVIGDALSTTPYITDLYYAPEPQGFPLAYTNLDILERLTTVDGSGSGLDADMLDGQHLVELGDGWINAGSTWTYASPTTFTVVGDQTSRYLPGTRLKVGNPSIKILVVLAASFGTPLTTVTVGGSTLANSALTIPQYSYGLRPPGLPAFFTFTPANVRALTGTITTVGTCSGTWFIFGPLVHFSVIIRITTNGTGAGAVVFDAPFAIADAQSMVGMEFSVGKMIYALSQTNSLYIRNYDQTYPGLNGAILRLSGVFQW